MEKNSKIYVAGHLGLAGSAIWNSLKSKGYTHLIGKSHKEMDLLDAASVKSFFAEEKPEHVILAAAHVGGIMANNTYRADFIYRNLQIQNNLISESFNHGVKKLLFLGSTCVYPRSAPQPISENTLLTGPLEYTNEPYAIAKIAGLKMCESFNIQYGTNYIAVMPTNLYGPNDNFNLETSHVLPAIIRKIHLAKAFRYNNWDIIKADLNRRPIENITGDNDQKDIKDILSKYGIFQYKVVLWGTGTPLREFLWSEDMADASVFIMENINFSDLSENKSEVRNCHINIGTGKEISIYDLAFLIKDVIGYTDKIIFDPSKPDGTPRKLIDVSKLNELGWKHTVEIEEGVKRLYEWYINDITHNQ